MHHFREHVRKGQVKIYKVSSELQLADIATKGQQERLFLSQRESLMQWESEYMTSEELNMPAKHLRACEVIEQAVARTLDQNQHAKQSVEQQLAEEEDILFS